MHVQFHMDHILSPESISIVKKYSINNWFSNSLKY
eukprot:UN22048